jgi:putative transposase
VVLEDLKIKNMTKSAKGTLENPGTNVKAKAGLNRAILHQNWGQFTEFLQYKADLAGTIVEKVNPAYTSQRCSACGHIARENRENQAVFICKKCGHTQNADHNAAINILYSYLNADASAVDVGRGESVSSP